MGVQSTGCWGGPGDAGVTVGAVDGGSFLTNHPGTGADRLPRCVHVQSRLQTRTAAGEEPGLAACQASIRLSARTWPGEGLCRPKPLASTLTRWGGMPRPQLGRACLLRVVAEYV